MATSGTTLFTLDIADVIEDAAERVGVEVRTGHQFRSARRSLNLLLTEWAVRGVNLWSLEEMQIPLVPGQADYNLPADTADILETVLRSGTGVAQTDRPVTRLSMHDYTPLTTKNMRGIPLQVYMRRERDNPVATVWPVPPTGSSYTLVFWRMRRLEDAGGASNNPDVPFRFYNALVAGLAYFMGTKVPEQAARLPMLKTQYDEAWTLAASDDRERTSIRIVPELG